MTTEAIETPTHGTRPILSRLNLFLLAALIIQGTLAAYVLWPRDGSVAEGRPLLGEMEASAVTKLTITEGEQVLGFEKVNGVWVLAGTDEFPATEGKVSETLEKILVVDGNRLVTQTANSHKRLQVAPDDFVRKVEVTTSDGTQTLYVGSSAGSGATHVRLDGTDETYLTNQIASFELNASASSWVDTEYFNVDSNSVTAFTLQNEHGTFTFQRGEAGSEGTGDWTLSELGEDEILDQTKIDSLLNQATSVRLVEPLGKSADAAYGLDNPTASVTFTVEEPVAGEESASDDGGGEGEAVEPETVTNTYTLQVGNETEEGGEFFARASSSDYYVLIAEFAANGLTDKTKADFLADPPDEEGAGDETGGAVPGGADSSSIFDTLDLTSTVEAVQGGVTETLEILTPTFEITGTEAVTETPEILTPTLEITGTEAVSEIGSVTATETISATVPVTGTE